MRINNINNSLVSSLSHLNLTRSKVVEELSSGERINRAADDAAGLSISEGMRAKIRGLRKANRNIEDGISYMNVKEAGLEEVHRILERMRELNIQALNDSYTDEDREYMMDELKELRNEIDNIATNTEFNNKKAYVDKVGKFVSISTENSILDSLKLYSNVRWTIKLFDSPDSRSNNLESYSGEARELEIFIKRGTYDKGKLLDTIGRQLSEYNKKYNENFYVEMDSENRVNMVFQGYDSIEWEGVMILEPALPPPPPPPPPPIETTPPPPPPNIEEPEGGSYLPSEEPGGGCPGVSRPDDKITIKEGKIEQGYSLYRKDIGIRDFPASIESSRKFDLDETIVNDGLDFSFRLNDREYIVEFARDKYSLESILDKLNRELDGFRAYINDGRIVLESLDKGKGVKLSAFKGKGYERLFCEKNVEESNLSHDKDVKIEEIMDYTKESSLIVEEITLDLSSKGSEKVLSKDQAKHIVNLGNIISKNSDEKNDIFHIGANSTDSFEVENTELSSSILGISSIRIDNRDLAETALSKIDDAVRKVSRDRSYIASVTNRMDSMLRGNKNYGENISAGESRIRDADMAKSIIENLRLNLLTESGTRSYLHNINNMDKIINLISY